MGLVQEMRLQKSSSLETHETLEALVSVSSYATRTENWPVSWETWA
jgi:hypothetical protein